VKIKRFANGVKNKNKVLFFYLALPVFLAVFFVFSKTISAKNKEIVINEIYATGNDDWIELYNTTDGDIDLANNYHMYKSVSASLGLLMRFGNTLDGSYPRGTIIKSHGYYLIVRDDASSNLIEMADAICTKVAFTWNGSGYTIYFGDGAISSANDSNIIDTVRFVDAQNNTAPEIQNSKSIGRLKGKDSDNNSIDFTLQNPTPGTENSEENISEETKSEYEINELNLSVKISQSKDIYPQIYDYLEAELADANSRELKLSRIGKSYNYSCAISDTQECEYPILKFTWDFGDNHKSYLFSTKHKYEETGNYNASLTVSDGSKKTIKNFTVNVEEFPHPNIKIVSINANPKGNDTDNETITLQNKSKKKVNLNGWSIATGWEKMYNHPISEDFKIKAGKEKEITREFSKFTLNNKKTKIELRYPDGEVACDAKYNKKKLSIAEGEVYIKGKRGWAWQVAKQDTITKKQDTNNIQNTIINNQIENNVQENTQDDSGNIPDADIVQQPKIERENKLVFNYNNVYKIELADSIPRILGAEDVREIDGTYHFTPEFPNQEHYAVVFGKNIFASMNLKINMLINHFFN